MTYQHLLWTVDQGVAEITLNRPEVLNSFNELMGRELQDALGRAADPSIRAVLLTGAGRGFSAGQDLAETQGSPESGPVDFAEIVRGKYTPIVLAIRRLEKPVVCAVNGVAAGAGANLAFCCDLVLAAEGASFIQAFAKIGLVPDTGGTFFLPRLVGLARSTELMMLADKLPATRAQEIGLISRTVPGPELMDTARTLARQLATQPTRAFAMIKQALNASLTSDLGTQLNLEAELQSAAGRTADHAEGVAAFLAKRAPVFTGQ
jgi:2-(1,2-epoxy-1,2-dihydrophenyl)acetyl-CoA isomerase